MNSQIKTLVEQALTFAYDTSKELGHKVGDTDAIFTSMVIGKYTELLINEAANYIEHNLECGGTAAVLLKQQFGIE